MPDFTAARINMVDSQIHTMGVVSEAVLEAYRTVPREKFVTDSGKKGVAYCDEDMPLGNGRWLMEPVTHARLVQAAAPSVNDAVLDVGGATGYSAAILAKLTGRVIAIDSDASLLAHAEQAWAALGYNNIVPHQGSFAAGSPTMGPYNLVFLNGSVAAVPAALFEQLAPQGRLVAVVRERDDKIGRARLFVKTADGSIGEKTLFDAAVPFLPGLEPRNEFVF